MRGRRRLTPDNETRDARRMKLSHERLGVRRRVGALHECHHASGELAGSRLHDPPKLCFRQLVDHQFILGHGRGDRLV